MWINPFIYHVTISIDLWIIENVFYFFPDLCMNHVHTSFVTILIECELSIIFTHFNIRFAQSLWKLCNSEYPCLHVGERYERNNMNYFGSDCFLLQMMHYMLFILVRSLWQLNINTIRFLSVCYISNSQLQHGYCIF